MRIVFIPVFIILLAYNRLGWALITFCVAAVTDGMDGLIARHFRQKTSLGAILDPIADKLLMSSSIVVLSLPQMGFANPIPIWLLLLVIFRDVFILLGGLAFIITYGFRVFPPTLAGKTNTVFQFLTVFAVLLYNWIGVGGEWDIFFVHPDRSAHRCLGFPVPRRWPQASRALNGCEKSSFLQAPTSVKPTTRTSRVNCRLSMNTGMPRPRIKASRLPCGLWE